MAVVARTRKHGTVYYATNRDGGEPAWERVGPDKREAHRRDRSMKREIAAGTYLQKTTGAATVGTFAKAWFRERTNRTVDNDQGLWANHVEGRSPWFLKLRLEDVRAMHVSRLVKELAEPYVSLRSGKPSVLAGKSVFLVFGLVNTMFRDARIAEKMIRNPCELPRGTFNKAPKTRRTPYAVDEVRRLINPELVSPEAAIFNMLAFYTGMREGEVCGRRFRDWDRSPEPLTALRVHSQYKDQPLKTERTAGEATRMVPVHAELAAALEAWWAEGFELVYRRPPTVDDYIVPCRNLKLGNHTGSSAYKLFRRSCTAAGVTAHTLHSTRHTFITLARRDGARKDVLERVTHNAKGEVIDTYTHFDWDPLCEAVSCFMSRAAAPRPRPTLRVVASGEPSEDLRSAKAPQLANAAKRR